MVTNSISDKKVEERRDILDYLDWATGHCALVSHYNFDGWHVKVHTNSWELLAALDDYYRLFPGSQYRCVNQHVYAFQAELPPVDGPWTVNEPEPGKTRVKEEYCHYDDYTIVKKIQTGVHLIYGQDLRLCCGLLTDNLNQVINFINNVYLDELLSESGQLFHAGGICKDRVGIGLAGFSGKGKSTLILKLIERGFDFVSNDRLVVDNPHHVVMHGIPKYPRVNPGTIVNQAALAPLLSPEQTTRYRALPAGQLWKMEDKYDAFVDQHFAGCKFRLVAELRLFIILAWDRDSADPLKLERVDAEHAGDLIETVVKSPGIMLPRASRRIGKANVKDYIDLLKQTNVLTLSGRADFDRAADKITRLLHV